MKLFILPLTTDVWTSPEMRLAVEEAQDAARRIRKKLDIRRERKRFSLACDRIESIALGRQHPVHSIEGPGVRAILDALPKEGRARYPFVSPQYMRAFSKVLPKEVTTQRIRPDAVVVILDPESDCGDENVESSAAVGLVAKADYSACEIDIETIPPKSILRRAHQQIRTALETGLAMGWVSVEAGGVAGGGLSRHEVLVAALREYIYLNKPPVTVRMVKVKERVPDRDAIARRERKWWYRLLKSFAPAFLPQSVPTKVVLVDRQKTERAPIVPVPLKMAFRDGSESAPFPLLCLLKAQPPKTVRVVRVALISGRHLELDSKVDVCLLRNSEISRRVDATIAEQEQLAHERCSELIQRLVALGSGVQIDLYHTGLEPAVIGVYRAIVDCLRSDKIRGRFLVVPKIYRGTDQFDDLKSWY